ncbi:hypothetical protein M011DRAFT_330759 [Sporormia fimetaria CBS 119925]|uniref:Ubiquitin 3 binding protein But2 C-terminal domain-containing protein n=1 Tax=Sporormia fimetaria CBS 119925 TaxID=1340428 RepID=A0A6A6UTV8_9PLEO|nr:hypothetical protein M011DRAFT_330759 [Sporormia fimetaria CBS 119925]
MRALLLVPLLLSQSAVSVLINRQFPHLIIPLDKRTPDTPLGTKYEGRVEHSVWTEISFDVPNNSATYCTLNFSLNTDPVKNAPRTLWGVAPFRFNISALEPKMDRFKDTWNNHPALKEQVGQVEVSHNGGIWVWGMSVPCLKDTVAQYVLYPDNPARDFGFSWFELDYDPPHGITYDMHG